MRSSAWSRAKAREGREGALAAARRRNGRRRLHKGGNRRRRQFSEAPPPRSPPPADRKPTPAEQRAWAALWRARPPRRPIVRAADDAARGAPRVAVMGAPPPPADGAGHHHHHSTSPRPRVGAGAPLQALIRASSPPRSRDESALDEFLASDVELLSTPQLERGLRAAGCRAIPPDDLSLRRRARAPGVAARPAAAAGRDAALRLRARRRRRRSRAAPRRRSRTVRSVRHAARVLGARRRRDAGLLLAVGLRC